jgi:hypothetical protein
MGVVPMEQGLLGTPSPIPTECLLLKNLFDPTTETEEDWHLDIAEDVKEECGKHGPVDHIFVDKDSRVRGSHLSLCLLLGAAARWEGMWVERA